MKKPTRALIASYRGYEFADLRAAVFVIAKCGLRAVVEPHVNGEWITLYAESL